MNIRVELPPNNEWLPQAIRQASRRPLLRVRIMGVVFGVLALGVGLASRADRSLAIPAFGLLLCAGLLLWASRRAPRLAVRRQPRYMRTEPMVLELTDTELTQTHLSARAELRWPAFDRVVETPDLWLLYIARAQVLYVPKAPLSETQRAEFAAHLAATGLTARPRYPD